MRYLSRIRCPIIVQCERLSCAARRTLHTAYTHPRPVYTSEHSHAHGTPHTYRMLPAARHEARGSEYLCRSDEHSSQDASCHRRTARNATTLCSTWTWTCMHMDVPVLGPRHVRHVPLAWRTPLTRYLAHRRTSAVAPGTRNHAITQSRVPRPPDTFGRRKRAHRHASGL